MCGDDSSVGSQWGGKADCGSLGDVVKPKLVQKRGCKEVMSGLITRSVGVLKCVSGLYGGYGVFEVAS